MMPCQDLSPGKCAFPNRLAKGHKSWHEQETSLPPHQRRKDLAAIWPCFQMRSNAFMSIWLFECLWMSLNLSDLFGTRWHTSVNMPGCMLLYASVVAQLWCLERESRLRLSLLRGLGLLPRAKMYQNNSIIQNMPLTANHTCQYVSCMKLNRGNAYQKLTSWNTVVNYIRSGSSSSTAKARQALKGWNE